MMKKFTFLLLSAICISAGHAQSVDGQWHGYFNEGNNNIDLSGGSTEYVLELQISGEKVSGTSYTYFENRRFFVICNLNGTYNKKSKKIVVNETERVKGSTPPDWRDCLQTHILYYDKEEGKELLKGDWKTSPYNPQKGGCGWGATTLSRRLINNTFSFNKKSRTPAPKPPVAKNTTPSFKDKNNNQVPPVKPPVVKAPPKTVKPAPAVVKNDSPAKKEITKVETPVLPAEKKPEEKALVVDKPFEKRSSDLLKTIDIEKESFRVDLYDNGDIDGDTISLFFNGKLLLAHKRLSDKAISLTLNVDDARDVNELVMYAENLGSIPPNTALMVVTDGDNRYEVRISSDLQKSGAIRFVHKPKRTQ